MAELKVLNNDNKGFDYWLNQDFLSHDTKTLLQNADVLIVPLLGFRNSPYPLFQREVRDLTEFLTINPPQNMNIQVCIDDESYKELSLCSDDIRLGEILLNSIFLPLVVNLLAEFIKYLISKKRMNKNKAMLDITLTITDKKRTKSFQFYGKAEDFSKTITQIKDLWEEE